MINSLVVGAYCRAEGQSPEDDPVGNFKIRHGGIRRGEQYALLYKVGIHYSLCFCLNV